MNVECRKIEELLGGYADGELSPREQARVESHLSGCKRCEDALAAIERVDHAVLALEGSPPSPADLERLAARVRNVVDAKRRPARRSWREFLSWPQLAPVAAAAAILFVVLQVSDRMHPEAERKLAQEAKVGRVEDQPAANGDDRLLSRGAHPKKPDGTEWAAEEKSHPAQGPRDETASFVPDKGSEAILHPNKDGGTAAKASPQLEAGTRSMAMDGPSTIQSHGPALSSWGGLEAGTPAPSPQRNLVKLPEKSSAEAAAELAEAEKKRGEGPNAARELAVRYGMHAALESDSTLAAAWQLRAIALIAEAHAASGSPDDCQFVAAAIERFIANHPADARIDSLRTLRAALPCVP
jgi:hypothetical protein